MGRSSNPYFKFKQFTVWHDRSSLRVCTEACLLGAYASVDGVKKGLDIGTGTGVLALMLAQRNENLHIDAIEIEQSSAEQAQENVSQSPFAERIQVYKTALQNWNKEKGYDFIISNPPFFENHLLSSNEIKNQALHTESLSLVDLANSVARLLQKKGRFVVLLPPFETQKMTELMQGKGLWPVKQLQIFQREEKALFRLITTFQWQNKPLQLEKLTIHEGDGKYSEGFRTLLKDYYLIF